MRACYIFAVHIIAIINNLSIVHFRLIFHSINNYALYQYNYVFKHFQKKCLQSTVCHDIFNKSDENNYRLVRRHVWFAVGIMLSVIPKSKTSTLT